MDPDTKEVTLYEIIMYESAGLWVDSEGHACLPILAVFDDGVREVRLLYADTFRKHPKEVDEETQWVTRRGKNEWKPEQMASS